LKGSGLNVDFHSPPEGITFVVCANTGDNAESNKVDNSVRVMVKERLHRRRVD